MAVLAVSVFDTCHGKPDSENVFYGLTGSADFITGKLKTGPHLDLGIGEEADEAMTEEALDFVSDNPLLNVRFLEVKGRFWRGLLEVPRDAKPGDYSLTVFLTGMSFAGEPRYTVKVYSDENAYKAQFRSYTERRFGFRPIWIAVAALFLLVYCLYASYRRSERRLSVLQSEGVGPIYKLAKPRKATQWEVLFGLGARHGVKQGDRLVLLDRNMNVVGEITASKVEDEASWALVDLDKNIHHSYLVALERKGPSDRGER
ncbi:MAG: hypothetical protein PHV85_08685 [Desulfovibrionaceae bacterium]|nr:hypothetical protein [Desulfovibrionaceae bacterium]